MSLPTKQSLLHKAQELRLRTLELLFQIQLQQTRQMHKQLEDIRGRMDRLHRPLWQVLLGALVALAIPFVGIWVLAARTQKAIAIPAIVTFGAVASVIGLVVVIYLIRSMED